MTAEKVDKSRVSQLVSAMLTGVSLPITNAKLADYARTAVRAVGITDETIEEHSQQLVSVIEVATRGGATQLVRTPSDALWYGLVANVSFAQGTSIRRQYAVCDTSRIEDGVLPDVPCRDFRELQLDVWAALARELVDITAVRRSDDCRVILGYVRFRYVYIPLAEAPCVGDASIVSAMAEVPNES